MHEWMSLHEAMQRIPEPIGERLCLNFTNTIEPRGGPASLIPLNGEHHASQHEYLADYRDFLAWSLLVGTVTEAEALSLQEQANQQPVEAQEILKQIIALREQLYTIFWSVASGRILEQQELDYVQQISLDALSHATFTRAEDHYTWQWRIEKEHLLSPIWPVVQSTVELLAMGDAKRIKVCPGAPGQTLACAWLFYDESKNGTRHWCSMADCGKRAKARRLTARRRAKREHHEA